MTILIRFVLISIIIYLLVRSFVRYFQGDDSSVNEHERGSTNKTKQGGVSKEVGEYVDYEEVD